MTHLPSPSAPGAVRLKDAMDSSIEAVTAGHTEHFEASYDPVLGETGRFIGASVLNRAESDLAVLTDWFGGTASARRLLVVLGRFPEDARSFRLEGPAPFEASLYCDAQTTPRPEPRQSSFFVALQLSDLLAVEVGWPGGLGSALARVLATALYPRRILGYGTASVWLDADREDLSGSGLPSGDSGIGAGTLFFNYLHHQLGFGWKDIAGLPGTGLSEVGSRLTGNRGEWDRFKGLLDFHFPPGSPSRLLGDNPFPLDEIPPDAGSR